MISLRLPPDIEMRLDTLAHATGRTKTFYVRQAIAEHLKDMEDYYLAAEVAGRVRAGSEGVLSLEEVEKRLGLED